MKFSDFKYIQKKKLFADVFINTLKIFEMDVDKNIDEWSVVFLENGAFFLCPETQSEVKAIHPTTYIQPTMSGRDCGIAVSLIAFNLYSAYNASEEIYSRNFHLLLDFAQKTQNIEFFYLFSFLDLTIFKFGTDPAFIPQDRTRMKLDKNLFNGWSCDLGQHLIKNSNLTVKDVDIKTIINREEYACVYLDDEPFIVTGNYSDKDAVKRAKALSGNPAFIASNYDGKFNVGKLTFAPEEKEGVIEKGGVFKDDKLLALNLSDDPLVSLSLSINYRQAKILDPSHQYSGAWATWIFSRIMYNNFDTAFIEV